jgi:hypothetical protein
MRERTLSHMKTYQVLQGSALQLRSENVHQYLNVFFVVTFQINTSLLLHCSLGSDIDPIW